MNNQDVLVVICVMMVLVLGAMLWLYYSSSEPEQTVLVSPFSGTAPEPVAQGLYKVQVKEWVHATFKYVDVYAGTAQECKVQYNILRKRGYSVTDVRVVQVV